MKMDQNEISSINSRLNACILILFRDLSLRDKTLNLQEKIALLHAASLRPKEISKILGKSEGHINKELALIRRKNK